MPGEQLVLGTAVGLRVEQVKPFLLSLARTGYSGDTVLFVDRRLRRRLSSSSPLGNLSLIPIRQWLPFKLGFWSHRRVMAGLWHPLQTSAWRLLALAEHLGLRGRGDVGVRRSLACLLYPPMDTRFIRYDRFLRTHAHERVLLTDVRDVLFQTDPFARLPRTGLAASLESPAYRIATEPHNAAWVNRVYGTDLLDRIGDQRVSCVGVTYGDRSAIQHYLTRFTQELLRLTPGEIGVGGADTAIHNKLLWSGDLRDFEVLEPLASPVVNLNSIDASELSLSDQGRLLNRDGSEISVVHQYDRQPELRRRLEPAQTTQTYGRSLRCNSL